MVEFWPGTHDKAAAEKEFLEIFKNADNKKAQGKLIKYFVRGFHHGYTEYKKDNTLRSWEATLRFIETAKKSTTQEDNAYYLGGALGSFLIGVEDYIVVRASFADAYANELLALAAKIASRLKAANKLVKPKFIRNRILVIARKNAGSLSAEKQKLLAQVASLFM